MDALYLVILLILFSFACWRLSNGKVSKIFFSLCIWGAGICAVAFFYNVGDVIFQNRLIEEIRKGVQGSQVGYRKARDGHFYVDISINGVKLNCLVDTGASDTILSQKDAIRLGINPQALTYSRQYDTANGKITAAPITLRDVYLKNYYIPYLEVSVSGVETSGKSLLGMSFLQYFDFFIKKDVLFLLQK